MPAPHCRNGSCRYVRANNNSSQKILIIGIFEEIGYQKCFFAIYTLENFGHLKLPREKKAQTYLQLPLQQWGAGNVYLLVLSS